MAGEYRKAEVLDAFPSEASDLAAAIRSGKIRLALTSSPIVGAVERPDLVDRLAAAFEATGNSYNYYLGLTRGEVVPVEIPAGPKPSQYTGVHFYAPGELFFNS